MKRSYLKNVTAALAGEAKRYEQVHYWTADNAKFQHLLKLGQYQHMALKGRRTSKRKQLKDSV